MLLTYQCLNFAHCLYVCVFWWIASISFMKLNEYVGNCKRLSKLQTFPSLHASSLINQIDTYTYRTLAGIHKKLSVQQWVLFNNTNNYSLRTEWLKTNGLQCYFSESHFAFSLTILKTSIWTCQTTNEIRGCICRIRAMTLRRAVFLWLFTFFIDKQCFFFKVKLILLKENKQWIEFN